MRAVLCRAHGHWRDMKVEDVPEPVRGPGEVRIAVRAAGVSAAAVLTVAGRHQNRSEPPFIPGTEAAGVVLEADPDSGLHEGDHVVAATSRGMFAEQAVVPADQVNRIPAALGFDGATLFPTIYPTAWMALAGEARIAEGETLLVHGAAGASGLAAVQVGRALGARVIATASTPAKREAVARAGAELTLPADDFRTGVLEATGGRGADVIFDPVGGDVFTQSMRCAAPECRLLPIGFASGDIPDIPANLVLVKNVTVIGMYWGYYTGWGARHAPSERARRLVRECFEALFGMADRGQLDPVVHAAFPMDDFAKAFATVESRTAIGKVVLNP